MYLTYQRTNLVADRVHTLSDVQPCLSVRLLRAGTSFALLLPPAAHLIHHGVHHTHLQTNNAHIEILIVEHMLIGCRVIGTKSRQGQVNNTGTQREYINMATLSGVQVTSTQSQSLAVVFVM